jgi:type VI secretion system secreted protein VgrG
MLADEGAATLNNIKVQREIKNSDGKNGGEDIGIAGNSANAPKYEKAYEDYLKTETKLRLVNRLAMYSLMAR